MVSDVISGLGWDCTDLRLGWGVEHLTLPINPTKKMRQIWSASLHWSHFANSCELRKRSLISPSLGFVCFFTIFWIFPPFSPDEAALCQQAVFCATSLTLIDITSASHFHQNFLLFLVSFSCQHLLSYFLHLLCDTKKKSYQSEIFKKYTLIQSFHSSL